MVNDFEKAIAAFVAMSETRQIVQPKQLNRVLQIYKKGTAPHRKIGLPRNNLFL